MKGAAAGCVMGLAGCLGIAAAVSWVLQTRFGHPLAATLGASALAGLLGCAAIGLLYGALKAWRERAAILGGIAGVAPTDGPRAVLVGTLEALGPALRGPMDGAACLAYSYTVTEDRGTGKRRVISTHFKGVGLAPSAIATPTGTYRLLTVPDIEGSASAGTDSERMAAFTAYARATTFTGPDTSAQELAARWADDGGAYRSDVAYSALDAVTLTNCRLVQQQVSPGARVCVFGTFSIERRGIVPSRALHAPPRLVVGSVDAVAATLRSTARTRLLLGIAAAAGTAGIVAAFIANG